METQKFAEFLLSTPRAVYNTADLGSPKFSILGRYYQRLNFQLNVGTKGAKIQCTHFRKSKAKNEESCIVYLHKEGGSRVDALGFLHLAVIFNCGLVCFDTCGSGHSDGENISFGYREVQDLDAVVRYLQHRGTQRIILLGRSMGATTALFYAAANPEAISCVIADSPCASLSSLVDETISVRMHAPKIFMGSLKAIAKKFIKSEVKKRAGYSISKVSPLKTVGLIRCPVLFMHGLDDTFLRPHHSRLLYDKCSSHGKRLVMVKGDHHSDRNADYFDDIASFIAMSLSHTDKQPMLGEHPAPLSVGGNSEFTEGKQLFLCRLPPTADPQSRIRFQILLAISSSGFSVLYPWSELMKEQIPFHQMIDYGYTPEKFVLKYRGPNEQINILTFLTIEAQEIVEVLNEMAAQSVKRLRRASVDLTIESVVQRIISRLQDGDLNSPDIVPSVQALIVNTLSDGDDDDHHSRGHNDEVFRESVKNVVQLRINEAILQRQMAITVC